MAGPALIIPGLALWAGASAGRGLLEPATRGALQLSNWYVPNELPTPPAILNALRTGYLLPGDASELMRRHGIPFFGNRDEMRERLPSWAHTLSRLWQSVYDSGQSQPSVGEIIRARLRGMIPDDDLAIASLGKLGFEKDNSELLLRLSAEIPGPSDLVRFGVREVWTPEIVNRFKLGDEFPAPLHYWLKQQGLGGSAAPAGSDPEYERFLSWARAYWIAHWQTIAPGQAYEMFQRLRPDRIDRFRKLFPGTQPFVLKDLELVLRQDDYPPTFRGRLASISYGMLMKRELPAMRKSGVIDNAELYEQFLDRGLLPDDASRSTEVVERDIRLSKYQRDIEGTRGRILAAYRTGTISREQAAVSLYSIGIRNEDELVRWNEATPAEREEFALGDAGISTTLNGIDLDQSQRLATKAISATHRLYVSGRISNAEATQRLRQIGITDARGAQYIESWGYELDLGRRELSTAQVQRFVREGIISATEGAFRLRNLGWNPGDIGVLVAEIDRSIRLDQAKVAEKTARTIEQQRRAAREQVRAAAQELRDARMRLARHSSPGLLRRWIATGLIGSLEAINRLTRLGWPLADAQRLVAESLEKLESNRKKAADRDRKRQEEEERLRAGAGTNGTAIAAKVRRGPPKGEVRRWYLEGLVSMDRVEKLLRELGYEEPDIRSWFADAERHRRGPALEEP